jgi:hypothetical protein
MRVQAGIRQTHLHAPAREGDFDEVDDQVCLERIGKISYRNHTALIVVAQNGKANVAQTIISSKSEAWKRRMDGRQNSLRVAARPM